MNGMLGTAAKRLAIQTISGLLMLKPMMCSVALSMKILIFGS